MSGVLPNVSFVRSRFFGVSSRTRSERQTAKALLMNIRVALRHIFEPEGSHGASSGLARCPSRCWDKRDAEIEASATKGNGPVSCV